MPGGAVLIVTVETADPQPAAPKPDKTMLYMPGDRLLIMAVVPTVAEFKAFIHV
jgi:hypothetical protein